MRRLLIVLVSAAVGLALPASGAADILVNYVPSKSCYRPAGSIEVGVWYKPSGDTRRAYRIQVLDSSSRVVFDRSGVAPGAAWRYYRVAVPRPGRYTVVYRLPTGVQRYPTNVVRC